MKSLIRYDETSEIALTSCITTLLENTEDSFRKVSIRKPSKFIKTINPYFVVVWQNVFESATDLVHDLSELGMALHIDHPLVSLGGYSEQFAFDHLLQSLQIPLTNNERSKVTLDMFIDYYADLSAAIDDDDYFIAIVRSNWP
eukprot:gene14805-16452_t